MYEAITSMVVMATMTFCLLFHVELRDVAPLNDTNKTFF